MSYYTKFRRRKSRPRPRRKPVEFNDKILEPKRLNHIGNKKELRQILRKLDNIVACFTVDWTYVLRARILCVVTFILLYVMCAAGQSGALDSTFQFSSVFASNRTLIRKIGTSANQILACGSFGLGTTDSLLTLFRFQPDGALDTSFYVGAVAGGGISDFAVLPSGKIIVAGTFNEIAGFSLPGIARINSDGSVDTTFQNFYNSALYGARGIQLLSDGRIVFFGDFNVQVNNQPKVGIVLLRSNGLIDTTSNFILSGGNNYVFNVAVQTDGKLIIFGSFTQVQNFPRKWLARVQPSGQLDLGFNPPDMQSTHSSLIVPPDVVGMLLQPDGKLLIWGDIKVSGTTNRLLRLNTDGTIDNGFSPPLLGTDQLVSQEFQIWSACLDSRSNIIVGGRFTHVNGERRPALMRLLPNGSPDKTFATNFISQLSQTNINLVISVALQSTNKLLFSGYPVELSNGSLVTMGRLNADLQSSVVSYLSIAVGLYPQILITGNIGNTYRIEYTTDLSSTNWNSLTNIILSTSPQVVFDTDNTRPVRRFYRSIAL